MLACTKVSSPSSTSSLCSRRVIQQCHNKFGMFIQRQKIHTCKRIIQHRRYTGSYNALRWDTTTAKRTLSTITGSSDRRWQDNYYLFSNMTTAAAALAAFSAAALSLGQNSFHTTRTTTAKCDYKHGHLNPRDVAQEDFEELMASHDIDNMPIYTSEDVAKNNGENGSRIWMSYGGVVYDVTDFIPNHPGGSEKILTAAGSAIEPFWHIYRQHFASDLPTRLMEHMAIGRLCDKDQQSIDESMMTMSETGDDPFANEPMRHSLLVVNDDTPFNAECPEQLLTENWKTPNSLFFIRNHHPVPDISKEKVKNNLYQLEIDLSAYAGATGTNNHNNKLRLSMSDLKKMKKETIVATIQCAANRRSEFNKVGRVSGTPWGQGAISTAKFGGVKLSTVLQLAGLHDSIKANQLEGMKHVRFYGVDGMMVSIPIEKAMDPYGDVLICYEMNDEPLPRDHGYPLRMVVPGYVGVRNIKWLQKIELATSPAEGPWQHGLNYKMLPPAVIDAKGLNLQDMPSINEGSIYSGISFIEPTEDHKNNLILQTRKSKRTHTPYKTVLMQVKGWAYAGGGRNVVRIDVTGNGGKTFVQAKVVEGGNQPQGRAWAWVHWECELPCILDEETGTIDVASRAVDSSLNVQPEHCQSLWNVRGLANNSWYRKTFKVLPRPRRRDSRVRFKSQFK